MQTIVTHIVLTFEADMNVDVVLVTQLEVCYDISIVKRYL